MTTTPATTTTPIEGDSPGGGAQTSLSPRALGFRMPAEWERQGALWLSWPLNPSIWPGCWKRVEETFAEVAAAASRFQPVRVNCSAAAQAGVRRKVAAAGGDLGPVDFFDHPTDDAWCRDHGPVFLANDGDGEVALADFIFNAWGKKFAPWDHDDAVPAKVAAALGLRRFPIPLVAEGGALETDGAGRLLTSASVLLDPMRNPGATRVEVEGLLRETLGPAADAVAWLPGRLRGDDTDGHVDTLARFVSPGRVLVSVAPNPKHPDHRALRSNRDLLAATVSSTGDRLEVVDLPLPAPVFAPGAAGRRRGMLPANYANFVLLNGAVLVPAYGQARADATAAAAIGEHFPGREVIPIDCSILLRGGGALHCITANQPAGR